jgi:hypothetical protein
MFRRVRDKMLVVSLCLAGAGILACVGALFDGFVSGGSIMAFLAATVPLGLAIIGVLLGFAWVCDKCETYLRRRADRLALKRRRDAATAGRSSARTAPVLRKWHGQ